MQDHTKPIHDTIGPPDDGLTSGFTESIDQERAVDSMSEEKGFGNVQEYYVSKSGPTRLFTATRYGKRYVLKCLKTDYLLTPVYQQAIVKEFEIGLLLEHPYICRTLAMEQLAGMGRTIVMEQVDGDTLQTLLSEKRLSPDLALRIASQTMDALDYMHSKRPEAVQHHGDPQGEEREDHRLRTFRQRPIWRAEDAGRHLQIPCA